MSYFDNTNVIIVMKYMADKAYRHNRKMDFFSCQYKLFADDMETVNYGFGVEIFADRLQTREEQDFVYAIDKALIDKGYFAGPRGTGGWDNYDYTTKSGCTYGYYDKESEWKTNGTYYFQLSTDKFILKLSIRIRNGTNCLEYLETCPETVKQLFRQSDKGCNNRLKGPCKAGFEYEFEGKIYWKCCCWGAAFCFEPQIDDIPHYIKLCELGVKK